MLPRDVPLTRAQIQEMVDEAVSQDRDVEEYVRGKISQLDLPEQIMIAGQPVSLIDYLVQDLPEYMPKDG
jgi:hypothetical protein